MMELSSDLHIIMQEDVRMEAERVMGLRLMSALGAADAMPLSSQEERLPWTSRAISIYQVRILFSRLLITSRGVAWRLSH